MVAKFRGSHIPWDIQSTDEVVSPTHRSHFSSQEDICLVYLTVIVRLEGICKFKKMFHRESNLRPSGL
jgi:hypothetical protein